MPANNRIYYASQAVLLQPQNSDGTAVFSGWLSPQGLQSVGMTTNFNLEQVFQLGQLELYDNVENIPEVEVTLNKVIDGTPPLYLMCMGGSAGIAGATGKELAELATNRVNFKLGIYPDTVTAATGNATHYVHCSGMYLSAINYTFPVEGNSTEEITLVGNNKVWNSGGGGSFSTGEFDPSGGKSPRAPSIARRFNVNLGSSVLPTGDAGIPVPKDRTVARPYVNNVTISSNLGREAIFELGRMAPYFRYVNFPVEVTSEFEVTASDGDYVDADDFSNRTGCTAFTNLVDKSVKIVVCGSGAGDNMTIDLGGKNKLTSVNYSGGDTGGGNATITYSFQTFNKLVVTGSGSFAASSWVDGTADTINYA
jgi:hypothetical protein